jgi:hypothetical protein
MLRGANPGVAEEDWSYAIDVWPAEDLPGKSEPFSASIALRDDRLSQTASSPGMTQQALGLFSGTTHRSQESPLSVGSSSSGCGLLRWASRGFGPIRGRRHRPAWAKFGPHASKQAVPKWLSTLRSPRIAPPSTVLGPSPAYWQGTREPLWLSSSLGPKSACTALGGICRPPTPLYALLFFAALDIRC